MMEHLSTLFYRLLMHSSICILEEFNFFYLFIIIRLKKIILTIVRNLTKYVMQSMQPCIRGNNRSIF